MKIGVIADDLTGGNGTGVKLSKLGYSVSTLVNYNNMPKNQGTNAVIIDTDSRYVDEKVAINRVNTVADNLLNWQADIIGKRIDSTIRGNIGAEIDALLEKVAANSVVILTPTYPESHRVVSGGFLLVKGIPVQLSDVRNDPVKPVLNSHVPTVIQQQSKNKVAHIALDFVLSGEKSLSHEIEQKIKEGNKIIVVDGISDEDIETLANAMVRIQNINFIPADPGPLTAAYVRAFGLRFKSNKKIIVTIGSVTANSHDQLSYLMEKRNITPIYVIPKELATSSQRWDQEVGRVITLALQRMENENIIVITTDSPESTILDLAEIAITENVTEGYLAKRISDGLAKIARMLVLQKAYEIGGCFTSGGDVTASFCAIGLVEGIHLNEEILPLIAHGHFVGGHFDGIPIVTKGGTAGDLNAIYTCIKYLESKY